MNPKLGPKTRPARIRSTKTVSMPAVPALTGRTAVPTAASTPSIARAFTSRSSLDSSAISRASTTAMMAPITKGVAVRPEASEPNTAPGRTNSGQQKATNPSTAVRASITEVRADSRLRGSRGIR